MGGCEECQHRDSSPAWRLPLPCTKDAQTDGTRNLTRLPVLCPPRHAHAAGASEQDGWAWVTGGSAPDDTTEGGSNSSANLEAYGLAAFVAQTIRWAPELECALRCSNCQSITYPLTCVLLMSSHRNEELKDQGGSEEEDASSSSGDPPPEQQQQQQAPPPPPPQQQQQQQDAAEDVPTLQMGFMRVEDPSLLQTSPTSLLMSQQMSLVLMTRQRVLQAQQARADAAAASSA